MAELVTSALVDIAISKIRMERVGDARKTADNHMIVAALIATVAFTAGFAMPGGYIQSGSPNQGMAVLCTNSIAFQAFIISDTLALLFSTSALFTYFLLAAFAQTKKLDDMFADYTYYAMLLNMLGLVAIIVAFITGTYAVLRYSYALAIAISVVASSTFLVHFTLLWKILKRRRKKNTAREEGQQLTANEQLPV